MKTYAIELQRITAMTEQHGLVLTKVDATVLPQGRRDDADGGHASTVLSLSVENARILYLLLKKQLGEVDGRKARSQR
jgi:hypothetical protein